LCLLGRRPDSAVVKSSKSLVRYRMSDSPGHPLFPAPIVGAFRQRPSTTRTKHNPRFTGAGWVGLFWNSPRPDLANERRNHFPGAAGDSGFAAGISGNPNGPPSRCVTKKIRAHTSTALLLRYNCAPLQSLILAVI
jgi:hypothetical protein